MKARLAQLTVSFAGDEPPTEFRIFRKGRNESSKGPFIFDDKAAALVMAAFKRAAVDGMIDLEHLSLDKESENFDPDARGWFGLELRNGDLWAVNVKWTADGERRLRERLQRYISPAFLFDEETGRVIELYNVAICAIPATYEAPALIAASKRVGTLKTLSEETSMDELKKIAAQLGLPETATLEEILAAIKALQDDDGETLSDEEQEALSDDGKGSDEEKLSKLSGRAPKLVGRVLAALSTSKDLKSRVEAMERTQQQTERDALLAANVRKIPKHLEAWSKTAPMATLKEFLSATPEPQGPELEPRRDGAAGNGAVVVTLTDEDKRHCAKHKIKEEDFLAQKKKIAEQDAERRAARG